MIYLLALFCLLQFLDGLTTHLVIRRGGREVNPVVLWVMRRIGTAPALVLLKALGIACGVVLYTFADSGGVYALAILTAAYAAVVINNYKAYRSLAYE